MDLTKGRCFNYAIYEHKKIKYSYFPLKSGVEGSISRISLYTGVSQKSSTVW